MATRLARTYSIVTDYTTATEATLAATLTGKAYGYSTIYNTDLGVPRIWDGAAFIDLEEPGVFRTTTVTISSAEILNLNSVTKQLLPAPGAGKAYFFLAIMCKMTYNSAAYATNTSFRIRQTGSTGVIATQSSILTTTATRTLAADISAGTGTSTTQYIANSAVFAEVQTGNPTAGNSPIDVIMIYSTFNM